MRSFPRWAAMLLTVAAIAGGCAQPAQPLYMKETGSIHAVVITQARTPGREALFETMREFSDVSFEEVRLSKETAGAETWQQMSQQLADATVVVLADIGEPGQQAGAEVQAALATGTAGVVVLGPALEGLEGWQELEAMTGAQCASTMAPAMDENAKTWVHVADPGHPVSWGMSDFLVETGWQRPCEPGQGPAVLLTAGADPEAQAVAWVWSASGRRVSCLQLGPLTNLESGFCRWVLHQAIRWSGGTLDRQ